MFSLETWLIPFPLETCTAEPIRVSARDLRHAVAMLFDSFIRAVDPHVFCLCLAVGVFSDDLNR